jgi:hypothetical protein
MHMLNVTAHFVSFIANPALRCIIGRLELKLEI